MDEKEKAARHFAQTAQQTDHRQTSPPRFSPQVRMSGENLDKATDTTGGLRNTQAALNLVKSKMQQNAATPESGTLQSLQADSRSVSVMGTEIARSIVKRKSVNKLNRQAAPQEQGNFSVLSDYVRQPSRLIKRENFHNKAHGAHEGAKQRTSESYNRTGHAAQVKANSAAQRAKLNTKKNAAKSAAAKKGTKAAAKGTAKATKAATTAAKSSVSVLGKIAIPSAAALPIILIVALVVIIVLVLLSPLGTFFSQNEDNPNPVSGIDAEVNAEYNTTLADLRKQYEDQGYAVNVYYGVPDGDDGDRLDNWRDVLTLYSLSKSNGEVGTQVYSDDDVQNIRNLYFDMNPMSVDTWTETAEVETSKKIERYKYVYNARTGRFEKITYYETVTETETQTIQHADIWINNMRYVSKLDQYALTEQQIGEAEFMLNYRHDPLWVALGLPSALSDGDYVGNVDDLIKNLPEGTKGAAIVEAALSRLGDPYSMSLRGQGRYIDCSGLSQWAYGLAGIKLPNTAASQAKWCVDNGKIIDRSAAVAGDLIFYTSNSARVKDRYMKIGHVGIYAGNGMMVDASSSKGCVVYRAVYGTPILWARPHV
nr:NlpC/P60 family protein [uncultured Christensenella sp.]